MLKFLKKLVDAIIESRQRRIDLMLKSGVHHGWY